MSLTARCAKYHVTVLKNTAYTLAGYVHLRDIAFDMHSQRCSLSKT